MVGNRDALSNDAPVNSIDAVGLLEALLGRKLDLDKRAMASDSNADFSSSNDDFVELDRSNDSETRDPKPDEAPKNLNIGCINPYALVEALISRRVDGCSPAAAKIISDVLATDYEELFDMRHDSVLYAGLELKRGSNDSKDEDRNRDRAEVVSRKDIRIITERDLETPDFSRVERVGDIEHIGIDDILKAEVTMARMQNGKLRLVLRAPGRLGRTVSNRDVTLTLNELCLPYRRHEDNEGNSRRGEWTPSNSSWRNIATLPLCVAKRLLMMTGSLGGLGGLGGGLINIGREQLRLEAGMAGTAGVGRSPLGRQFDDPVQGALGNSWFVAALFSVFWADPSSINRCTRVEPIGGGHHRCGDTDEDSGGERNRERRTFKVKFHDKGGENNAKTATVEVDYRVPVNNSDGQPVYCRASDGCEPWPALYEKAFAKWISEGSHHGDEENKNRELPDLTLLHAGDPVKAMAQINGRRPEYFYTAQRSVHELVGLVRRASVNHRTINPMCVFTYPTGDMYRGSNLVANHAYSVLGWAELGQRQHIIVRNPWGITEQPGLTSYPGIQDCVEPDFWGPAAVLDKGGVLAVEANAFKEYFACLGIVKRE
jgi:hypothetical protein